MATINEGLTQITSELKDTNLRFSKASEAYKAMLPLQAAQNSVLSGIGGAVKDNLAQSTSGFKSFIDQLESLPVFGAISGIAKTLGGKMFSALRQRKEDANLAKQLGITKQEVAIRRKEQEMLSAQAENNQKLLDAAKMLGYSAEQFEKLTNANQNEELSAAEVEKAREDRRANEGLVAAVEGVGKDISNLELEGDEENKGFFSGILDSVKGFVPAIGAALLSLGTTVLGGLVALGTKIVFALKGGLGGLGKLMRKIPGGKALGNIFSKSLGGLKNLGGAAGNIASKAGGGLLKGAGSVAKMGLKAAKFIPGAGLAITAASGLWDGLTAGFKEYGESGSFTSALKEGTAGALSGITFGLVSQETISNGMSAIGDFAKKGWDGFTNLAGGAMEGLSNIGSSVGGWFSSWWSDEEEDINKENEKSGNLLGDAFNAIGGTISSAAEGFNNLTGLEIPTNLTEVKDAVGNAISSAAEGFNNLTGLNLPTNLTELKDGVANTFNNIGQGFTNLTGMEVPTFDEVTEKVGAFANNMKENISKGWESVTNMASNAWGGVKSFFGFGKKDEVETPETSTNNLQFVDDAEVENSGQTSGGSQGKSAAQMKLEEVQTKRAELKAQADNLSPYQRLEKRRIKDADRKLAREEASLTQQVSAEKTITTGKPTQATNLQTANTTASDISREYMNKGSGTTVINAPNNSTNVTGGGGGGGTVPLPVAMEDRSSASMAARVNNF
jgi:hypothetical protein